MKNGKSVKKQNSKLVPVLDEEFTQPENIAESPVMETQQQAVAASTHVDKPVTSVADNITIDLLRDGRVVKLIDALMLGRIHEQQGNKVKAIENYERFLDLWKDADPGLVEVEDTKQRLANLKAC